MDLLSAERANLAASHSDSELSDMESSDILESSLKRHSHFFLSASSSRLNENRPRPRSRPRSVPLLSCNSAVMIDDEPASPLMTVLDDSSSERVSDGTTDGAEEASDGPDRDGIRYVGVCVCV